MYDDSFASPSVAKQRQWRRRKKRKRKWRRRGGGGDGWKRTRWARKSKEEEEEGEQGDQCISLNVNSKHLNFDAVLQKFKSNDQIYGLLQHDPGPTRWSPRPTPWRKKDLAARRNRDKQESLATRRKNRKHKKTWHIDRAAEHTGRLSS